MSQNNVSDKAVVNAELSMRHRYVCFMSEESKERLNMFVDVVDLMNIFLGDTAENKDSDTVQAGRMKSLFQILSEELARIESGMFNPGGTFSEYQGVNGLEIIKRYGANKAESLLRESPDDNH